LLLSFFHTFHIFCPFCPSPARYCVNSLCVHFLSFPYHLCIHRPFLIIKNFARLCCDFPGEDLAERGAQETSSVVVETVQKVAKSRHAGPILPLFKSDASKVTSKGMGLKKAYLQKQNMFTVHAGDAGRVTSSYQVYHF
jgi:hypothetical protein